MFRGREQAHPERGRVLLHRLYEDIEDLAVIEQEPLQEGRNMSMLLRRPRQPRPSQGRRDAPEGGAERRAEARRPGAVVCFNSRPDAEDEDPLRHQEAVPQDRHRQAPGPARLLEPHPREEVAEAQAADVASPPRSRRPDRKRVRTLLAGKGG